jgi:glutathione peroxidase
LLPNIPLKTIHQQEKDLSEYSGKTLLIVNVASQCGFTPQYRGLQDLYTEFMNRGFEILAFPCNQFGSQEPGTAGEIAKFCETEFGVTFELFEKTDVNGPNTHPLFTYVKSRAPGIFGTEAIKWNFTKFLINKSADSVKRYGPQDGAEKIKTELIHII